MVPMGLDLLKRRLCENKDYIINKGVGNG